MIRFILERLWPALIPLLLYVLWHVWRARKYREQGLEAPKLKDGPWMATLLIMLGLAALCLIVLGVLAPKRNHVAYEPARIENGKIVKGHLDEQ
jgi:hypothetical protein